MNHAVDPAALARIDRLGGAGFARRLIGTFLAEAPKRLGTAQDACARRDDAALAAAAHGFISSAGNLGASELGAAARRLERDAEDGRRERYADGVAELMRAFETVRAELVRLNARPRVAVVEDNADNRLLLAAMLDGACTLTQYTTGPDALAGIRADPPDVVLLDISLPGMDGTEVLAGLRADAALRTLPVIALTAHAMTGDREEFLAMGFDDYVTKPILDESILLAAIARHAPVQPTNPVHFDPPVGGTQGS